MNRLLTLSVVDGRYADLTERLRPVLSEFGLIRQRVRVEIEYFIFLSGLGLFELLNERKAELKNIYENFTLEQAEQIKEIERKTKHDVKAVEYYLREQIEPELHHFIHFGLTSEDVNSTSYMLMLKESINYHLIPMITAIVDELNDFSCDSPMLALTHGQPAVTTTMKKELCVFSDRILSLLDQHYKVPYENKFGGAVGTLAGHYITYPEIEWTDKFNEFNKGLGLERLNLTTQVNNYDSLTMRLSFLKHINTVLLDLVRDIWSYISRGLFIQALDPDQVGSSTMPQKINPIDFENAEGNLGLSNALYAFLEDSLPVSRMQRDLSGSTVIRNLGVAMGHSLIAYSKIRQGLKKLKINTEVMMKEIKDHEYSIIMEPIQLILRKHGISNGYELCKDFSRIGKAPSRKEFTAWVEELPVTTNIRTEILKVNVFKYLGMTAPDGFRGSGERVVRSA